MSKDHVLLKYCAQYLTTIALVVFALNGCMGSDGDTDNENANSGNILAADVLGTSPMGGANQASMTGGASAISATPAAGTVADPMTNSSTMMPETMAMTPADPGMGAAGGQDNSMMGQDGMNAGMQPGDGAGTPPNTMPPPAEQADADGCYTRDFNIVRDSFMETDSGSLNYISFNQEVTSDNPVSDLIVIELHPERGFPMQPGRYDLAEVGQDISQCQICVIGQENLNFQRRTRDHILMGKTGIVEITAIGEVGQAFQARFIDVKMHKVEIRRAGFLNTLTSEYVEDGFVRCADGFDIDVIRKARPAMIGDPVPEFELLNCETGEMESIHQIAGSTGAIWFIGTAGWCGACRRLFTQGDMNGRGVPSPMQYSNDTPPEIARVIFVMGEDSGHMQADRDECRRYARSYTQRFGDGIAAKFYVDHDGVNAFSQLFGHLNTYTSADGRFGLPWNAVVQGGETPVYRYADRSGQPERLIDILTQYTGQ